MDRFTDLTGQKFGRLTVISRQSNDKRGCARWLCQCECGKTKTIPSRSLLNKNSNSCGCLRIGIGKKDLVGKRFLNLLVIEDVGRNKHRNVLYKCKCDCGNFTIVPGSVLRRGDTGSCGCRLSFKRTEQERFFSFLKKTNSCWLWTGNIDHKGYGSISVKGHPTKAHRFSYKIFKGDFPKHKLVCHTCDNPKCVNPEHLFLGNHKINADDASRKGRLKKGEDVHCHKLTREKVKYIRFICQNGYKKSEIAKFFNISISTVRDISTRKTWRHL